jgi:hypothetical protein
MGKTKITQKRTKPEPDAAPSVRATISFPSDRYATLEEIAKQKKVSLAWVVRDAIDSYIEAKWPLHTERIDQSRLTGCGNAFGLQNFGIQNRLVEAITELCCCRILYDDANPNSTPCFGRSAA